MLIKGTHSREGPVNVKRLRLLTISYVDFSKNVHHGQMIVLDTCEEAVLEIFKELFK